MNDAKEIKDKIILKKSDYDLLVKYVFSHLTPLSSENRNAEQLYEEIKNAEVVDDARFPGDVIGLNSVVEVEDKLTGRQMKFKIVQPGAANLGRQCISVYAPIGIALMGYRKGDTVKWEMPSGLREFIVRNVNNMA
jgi:regulator of nucleoside diphosphate kinase